MAFIAAAIGTIATTVGAAFAAGGFFTTFWGRLLLSVALSALQAALMGKPREPGIKTKVTQTGGMNPLAFPLMKYATAGTHVCPPMSHGKAGKTPNAYLTYVILLSDVPGCALSRVMVNSEYVEFSGTPHADYGLPATGTLAGYAWLKYYDGTQTVADPMLIAKYGGWAQERPWTADMVGLGCAYAILTFRYNRELLPGLPRVRFEMNGIPLYDPRKDSTVGGTGAHRWSVRSTWEPSVNPMVGVYNVMRGIELLDGSVYGGGFPQADIPLPGVFAAMNECDLTVSDGDSGTEPQFRAGLEVSVDEEPADVIAELMKACSGQVAEIGGNWKFRVGPPGLAVMAMTDADVVISQDQNFRPFPNFASSFNGAHASYPDPESAWEPKEAPPKYDAVYEAADQGQRLIADLNLVAVPYPAQVRRLMHAWVEEERRFRRHDMTLPPDYALLEPLDAISWTSPENGYTAKVFEIAGVTEDLMTGLQRVMLRERDSADYSYPELPAPDPISILPDLPDAQTVPDFAVTGISIPDATGAPRRPALQLEWEPDLEDVTAILWEVRLQATGVVVASGTSWNVAAGLVNVTEGIIASTTYEVRAKAVVDRPSDWTAWVAATTPATLITGEDIASGAVTTQVAANDATEYLFSALPVNTVLASIALPNPSDPWAINVSFDIRRANGSGGTFNIALQERRVRVPLNDVFQTVHTWTIMTDGEPGNNIDWWGRWHQVVRGGIFTSREYRLMVTANSSSPNGRIRLISLVATRVTK